jgi:hypothetical protein
MFRKLKTIGFSFEDEKYRLLLYNFYVFTVSSLILTGKKILF